MRTSLKQRLRQPQGLLAPGVYDALTALVAQQAGHDAVYLSGAAVSYTRFGRSDVGLTTATEAIEVMAQIAERVDVSVIVDADTGFGNALNVQRSVLGFERAGAAMIQLEDQSFPKRCGHLANKSLVSVAEMCGKLKAALDVRRSDGTLILARTDAIAVEGFDVAMERAEAYLACGVDALFIEAPTTIEQMDMICSSFADRIPLLANMVEGGDTPLLSVEDLEAKGYRIVIFPGGTVRFLASRLQHYYQHLRKAGTTQVLWPEMLNFDELNALIGTPELMAVARRYEK